MQKLYQKLSPYAWILVLVIFVPIITKMSTPDSDAFFLINTGKYIVENGSVPTINPFVIHESLGFIVQQWGFDVMLYGIYATAGYFGLWIATMLFYALAVFLFYKYARLFTDSKKWAGIATLLASLLFLPWATLRPTILTVSVLLSLLYCLQKHKQTHRWQWLLPLPFLALFEVNMHASFYPVLFVFMLTYLAPRSVPAIDDIKNWLKSWLRQMMPIAIAMLSMVLVGFLNPYQLDGMLYLMKSYGVANTLQIYELQAPAVNTTYGIAVICGAVLLTLSCLHCYRQKNFSDKMPQIYLLVGTLILASMHLRNVWQLAFPLLAILPALGEHHIPLKEHSTLPSWQYPPRMIVIPIACVALSLMLVLPDGYSPFTTQDSRLSPIQAAEYLDAQDEKDDIILFTDFNNGAYMAFRGYKGYIDARPECYAPAITGGPDITAEYKNVMDGQDLDAFLQKYRFTHVLSAQPAIILQMPYMEDYEPVVVTDTYVLYEHVDWSK